MLQKKQFKSKWGLMLTVCLLSLVLLMGYPSITQAAAISEGQTAEQATYNLKSQNVDVETQASICTSGEWQYGFVDGGCSIYKYTGNAAIVTIPNSLNGNKVVKIDDSAFDGNTAITKIIVPSSVRYILDIGNVPNLTEVELNEGLYFLGGLMNNPKLTKVNIPSSVYIINSYVFYNTPINVQNLLSSNFKYYGGVYYKANSIVFQGTRYYDKAHELLNAINNYRAANGLSALTMDSSYTELAMVRAAEQDVYSGHKRPTGVDVVEYENTASGFDSVNSVMTAWKNSSLHNAALLTTDEKSCGIGVWKNSVNGDYQWVVDFKDDAASDLSTNTNEQTINQTIEYNKDKNFNDFFTHSISGITNLKAGSTSQLTHVVKNSHPDVVSQTNAVSTWTSSNAAVATVDGNGKVTAKRTGTTVITAKSGTTVSKTTVTVKGNSTTPTNPTDSSKVTMYRLYNPNSGEHFYTANVNEKNHIVSLGWKDEGVGWTAPKSGDPVYRLYNKNGGEHHYTLSQSERNNLMRLGWSYEGIGWYSDKNKSVPLYRQYNPNAFANNHNYTTSKSENNWLVSLGWKAEGIGWYGVK